MAEQRLLPLPPLHALRSFHAAARFGQFREAAQALGLSESAISHQVRKLESYLGQQLFERTGNKVRLTEAGQSYFDEIEPALNRIRAATEALAEPSSRVSLTLPNSLATLWLIPRLAQIEAALPEISLRMVPTSRLVDLRREQIDLAIRYGAGQWPGVVAHHLLSEQTFPVCRPGLIAEGADPATALVGRRLLLSQNYREEWKEWAQARGIEPPSTENALILDGAEQIMLAAAEGLGIGIGSRPIADAWLSDGRLSAPFGTADESGCAYFLVHPAGAEISVPARRLARFLMEMCKSVDDAAKLFPQPSGRQAVASQARSSALKPAKPESAP
jgi:LysR family glycine cleavage system transcriptional activator